MSTVVTNFGAQALNTVSLPTVVKWIPSSAGQGGDQEYPVLTLGTAGQVLTVNPAGTDYLWITPTNVPLTPNIIDTASDVLVAGQPNIVTFAGLSTVTLPATVSVGQFIQITCLQGSTFQIAQLASQQIRGAGNVLTTIGVTGSVTMPTDGGSVTLECVVANTFFNITSVTDSVLFV